ncbi:MAG: type I glyceraldehyde-3-phosphate dehydrogenase [Candidatus Colwellbacteria bacterium]|nr:type I glyceraldehyde-3-phosphate dehydrogenase [Candidatus Colwellbacteria bacterium]
MAKIAINGFGRIGRLFFRAAFGHPDIDIVAVNDLGSVDNLAYLLKYDTVYRAYPRVVEVKDGNLVIDGKVVKFIQEKDPTALPWGDMGVDVVVESTGAFESFEKASAHKTAGAKRVVITAPAKDAEGELGRTVLLSVNEEEAEGVSITSNGSCTTNACSPVIAVLSQNPGIEKALLNTTHAYTATQSLTDSPVKGSDMRRGRAAAQNIIPSTTGAAISVTRAVKGMDGLFDGISVRVPSVTGSLSDITFVAKRNTTPEEINGILREAAATPAWSGIFAVTDEQLVSSDIIGTPYAAIVDAQFTKVVGGNLVKVLAWYDNESGYVSTLIGHVLKVAKLIK